MLDWLAQLLGLPRGWHGHIEDTASTATIAALAAARTLRPGGVVYASEQANFSVEKAARLLGLEFRTVPVDDAFRMRADFALDDATAVVATVGTTAHDVRRPGARARATAATRRACGCTSTPPMRARLPSAPSSAGASTASSAPTRSSSTRTSGSSRRWTARRSGRGGPRRSTRRSRSCPTTSPRLRGRARPQGLRPGARPPLPRAQALGRAALVRRRGPARPDPRARSARRSSSRRWVEAEPGWEVVAPHPFSTVCFRHVEADNDEIARTRDRDRRALRRDRRSCAGRRDPARDRERAHDRGRHSPRVGGAARVRAVIFDLWETLIDWDRDADARMLAQCAERVGFDFHERWSRAGRTLHGADPSRARGRRRARRRDGRGARLQADYVRARASSPGPARSRRCGAARLAASGRPDHRLHRGRRAALAGVGVRRALRRGDLLVARWGCRSRTRGSTSHCCEALGVEPGDAVFVGDGANDELAGARARRHAGDPDPPSGRGPFLARAGRVHGTARDVDSRGAGGARAVLITTMNDVPGYRSKRCSARCSG